MKTSHEEKSNVADYWCNGNIHGRDWHNPNDMVRYSNRSGQEEF